MACVIRCYDDPNKDPVFTLRLPENTKPEIMSMIRAQIETKGRDYLVISSHIINFRHYGLVVVQDA